MRIGLLGPVVAERADGTAVPLGGPKQKAVLVLLALQPRAPVSAEALCDAIWGESLPPRPHRTLSVYVSTLRAALSGSTAGRDGALLDTVPGGYCLGVADGDVDVGRFRAVVTRARKALEQGRPGFARGELGDALSECRGIPLEDLLGLPFAVEVSEALVEEQLDARGLCIQADLDLGRPREVVAELVRLTQSHPLRERFWGQLMLALYLDGRQAQSLETYARARRVLLEETGLDPHPDLVDLERRILAQDETLRPRPPRMRVDALPRPLTELVGREGVVAGVVTQLLDPGTRLLTLTGPGGAGKTHLALEVAHRLAEGGRQVRFVDCAGAEDRPGLVTRLADCLGLDPADELADVGELRDEAAQATLVTDNLEQVASEAGRLLTRLLERAPLVRVLATSRLRLGCGAERVVVVPPLDWGDGRLPDGDGSGVELPAAVEMFLRRVTAAFPDVRLEDQLNDVRELCQTLGGLPLAIELAAGQARTMSPRQYRSRVQALLATPSGSAGGALRASIEASLRLLPSRSREAFPQLAVFSGGFTLEALDAVCADPGDAVDPTVWLADLVDASLVCPSESPAGRRFTLLEPLRLAAAAMAPTTAGVSAAHAHHYVSVGREALRQLASGQEGNVQRLLRADAANWAQALRWATSADPALAVDLLDSWTSLWLTEMSARPVAKAAFEALHDAVPALSPRDGARFRALRGGFTYVAGDAREAMGDLREAAPELERLAHEPRLVSRAFCWLAAVGCTIGEADVARAAAREARRVAESSGSAQLMSVAWDLSAFVAVSLHDLTDAETAIDRSIELADLSGDEIARGFALCTRGDLLVEQGRDDELRGLATEILRIAGSALAPDVLELHGLRFLSLAELHEARPGAAAELVRELIPRWAGAHGDLLDVLVIAAAVLTEAPAQEPDGPGGRAPDHSTLVGVVRDLDTLAAALDLDVETQPRSSRERLAPYRSAARLPAGTAGPADIDVEPFLVAVTQRVQSLLEAFLLTTSPR